MQDMNPGAPEPKKPSCRRVPYLGIDYWYVPLMWLAMVAVSGCGDKPSDVHRKSPAEIRSPQTDAIQGSTPKESTTERDTPQQKSRDSQDDKPAANAGLLPRVDNKPNLVVQDIAALKETAMKIIDGMANQFPDDPDAMEAKARFYRMIGKLDIAKACWDHAIAQAPKYAYAHQGLGSIALRNSDYQAAVQYLTAAVQGMPGDATAAHELSDALMKKGDAAEAIRVLETQVALKPQSSDSLQLLGQARLSNRDYAGACDAFEKSLELAPENHLSQQGLGAALVRLGKREEAKKWLTQQKSARSTSNMDASQTQAAERSDIAARLTYAAHVYLKHEKPDLAIEVLRVAAANDPRDEDARRLLVKLYQQVNQPQQAIDVAKQLVEISPNNLGYKMTIGTISQRQKDWRTAQESFEVVVKTMPSRPEGYAALVELSIVSGRNMDKAMELARTVTELRGTAGDFATYGQTLAMNGKLPEAIAAMKIASMKDPESQSFKSILEQLMKSQAAP